ncbi:MAG: hypothetical protein MK102_10175 [Fuerstiella sp.]|nr:hypothetical protein [Fuerstiella sp.]
MSALFDGKVSLNTGRTLLVLVGVVLILAGVLKIVNVGADDMLDGLEKASLMQHRTLISVAGVVCGVLLLLPWLWRFGVFMSSAYWGGAIVSHLTYDDSVALPAVFLSIMWLGAGLRGLFRRD